MVGRGRVPTSYANDTAVRLIPPATQTTSVVNDVPEQLFLAISAPMLVAGAINAEVRVEYAELYIGEISPTQGGNTGNTTAKISGAGFNSSTSAVLVGAGGNRVTAQSTRLELTGTMFATFNLAGTPLGPYALEVIRSQDSSAQTLPDAFQIVAGAEGRLKLSLDGPNLVRSGRKYSYRLHFENIGEADMPAPFVQVTATSPGAMFWAEGRWSDSGLVWLVTCSTCRGDVLPPGTGGDVNFEVNTSTDTRLRVGIVVEDERPFDWRYIETRLRPSDLSDTEWNQLWPTIVEAIGSQNRAVLGYLRATNAYNSGSALADVLLEAAARAAAETTNAQSARSLSAQIAVSTVYKNYTKMIAWQDVKIYEGGTANQLVYPDTVTYEQWLNSTGTVSPAAGSTFLVTKPTIIVTHGWRTDYTDPQNGAWEPESEWQYKLAARLAKEFGKEYNVVWVVWPNGSNTPIAESHSASGNAVNAGQVLAYKLKHLGYDKWDETVFIGHSFGNAVNAHAAALASTLPMSSRDGVGTALLLSPASLDGFDEGTPPPYTGSFRRSISITAPNIADDNRPRIGDITLQYLDPPRNDVRISELLYWKHGVASILIGCFLLNGGGDSKCNGINTSAVTLVEVLIKNQWEKIGLTEQINDNQRYTIDRFGNISMQPENSCGPNEAGASACLRTYGSEKILYSAPKLEYSVSIVRAMDPNDKVAPAGFGEQHIVGSGQPIRYVINFENMPSATAPVQEVHVTDILNADLDLATLQFDTIEFGNHSIMPGTAPGILEYGNTEMPPASVVTGQSDGPMVVQIQARADVQTRTIEWYLRLVDSGTGDFPMDPLAGFLPPEDGTGRGQGYVSFTIHPKVGTAEGTVIENQAAIVFDTNDPIATNNVMNTIGHAVDLTLDKVGQTQPQSNDAIVLTYRVINDGPDVSTNTTVNAVFPEQLQFTGVTSTIGSCQGTSCTVGTLQVGQEATISYSVQPIANGGFAVTTGASSTEYEINGVDNIVMSDLVISDVVTPGKMAQSITFAPVSKLTLGSPAIKLQAVTTSGLSVTFQSLSPAVCTVNGEMLTLVTVGDCHLRASQAGNAQFLAAPDVDQIIKIQASTPGNPQTYLYLPAVRR